MFHFTCIRWRQRDCTRWGFSITTGNMGLGSRLSCETFIWQHKVQTTRERQRPLGAGEVGGGRGIVRGGGKMERGWSGTMRTQEDLGECLSCPKPLQKLKPRYEALGYPHTVDNNWWMLLNNFWARRLLWGHSRTDGSNLWASLEARHKRTSGDRFGPFFIGALKHPA
jgi:hypothetical protein